MKSFFSICLGFLLFALVFGCSTDDNNAHQIKKQSSFKGVWTGTYSGMSQGTWMAVIDEEGEFSGSTQSAQGSATFIIEGEVDDTGNLEAYFYVNHTIVGEFSGTLSEMNGGGTWENSILNLTGTWQGSKE